MTYFAKLKLRTWQILAAFPALSLLLAVACGAAAPEASSQDTAAPAPTVAAAPTATAQPAAPPQDATVQQTTLVIMMGGGGDRFLPTYATNCHSRFNIVHDFLVRTSEDREYIPGLASAWEVSQDGFTWTFTIRDDAPFHDGRPVTAGDVYFDWLHAFGPDAPENVLSGSARRASQNTQKIEQISPSEVSITHNQPDSGFLGFMSDADGACQGVVLPGRDINNLYDEEEMLAYDRDPVGAGIMELVREVTGEVLEFERFDDYYYQPANGLPEDRRVPFQSLELRKVPEEATRAAALRAGEADIAPVSLDTKDQVVAGGGKIIVGREATHFRVILLGCYDPQYPCHDKRVRQALAYAIDKERMRDELYGGPTVMEVKGWAAVTPSTIGYAPDLDPYPYDPEKARQLLAEAGYKTPTNPGGKDFGKLIVNTWVSRAVPFMPESAQLAAEFWRDELGIDAEVRVGDEGNLKRETSAKGPLHGQVLWRDNESRRDAAAISRSAYGTPPTETEKGSYISEDPEIVEIVREGMKVMDPAKRDEAWHRVFQRLREEQYEVGIGYINLQWGVSARVVDWQPLPQAFYPSALHTVVLQP